MSNNERTGTDRECPRKPDRDRLRPLADNLDEILPSRRIHLEEAYQCLREGSAQETHVILVERPSGCCVAFDSIRTKVLCDGGFFFRVRFDPFFQRQLHGAFADAIDDFATHVVSRGPDVVKRIRSSVRETLDEQALRVLLSIIPALEQILGPAPDEMIGAWGGSSQEASTQYLQSPNRSKHIFGQLLRSMAAPDMPLVVVLDDLQGADEAALDVIEALVPDSAVGKHHILFVVTARPAELGIPASVRSSPEQRIASLTASWRSRLCVNLITVVLQPLKEADVWILVAFMLQSKPEKTQALAGAVWLLSGGKTFYVEAIVEAFVEKGVLRFEQDEWRWEEKGLLTEAVCSGSTILQAKFESLPQSCQDFLKTASCLGFSLSLDILRRLPFGGLDSHIAVAVEAGFLSWCPSKNRYSFAHHLIQESVYNQLSTAERSERHCQIARRLWRSYNDIEDVEEVIYILLGQFMMSPLGIAKDRQSVAELCLRGGQLAAETSSFATSYKFCSFGLSLLGDRPWRDSYELALGLHNAAAEMAYGAELFQRVFELVPLILENCRTHEDGFRAHSINLYALGSSGHSLEALNHGFRLLEQLGEKLPSNPNSLQVVSEFLRVKRRLGRETDESLLRRPLMKDTRKLATIQVLNLLSPFVFLERPKLTPILGCRMITLTLDHGLSALSSVGWMVLAFILATSGKRQAIEQSYRYGLLAFKLCERFQARSQFARIHVSFYVGVHPWKRSVGECIAPLRNASVIAFASGDIHFGHLGMALCCHFQMERVSLVVLKQELIGLAERATQATGIVETMVPIKWLVDRLVSPCFGPFSSPEGAIGDEHSNSPSPVGRTAYYWMQCHRTIYYYLSGDISSAALCAKKGRPFVDLPYCPTAVAMCCLFDGLVSVAVCRLSGSRRCRAATRHLRMFRRWAEMSPQNFLGKYLLLRAEVEALRGNRGKAYRSYVASIGVSRESGFLMETAIACELLSKHLTLMGATEMAKDYLISAHSLYSDWGARSKVHALEDVHPQIFAKHSNPR